MLSISGATGGVLKGAPPSLGKGGTLLPLETSAVCLQQREEEEKQGNTGDTRNSSDVEGEEGA